MIATSNSTEVVIAKVSIVPKNMVAINDFIKCVTFEPRFLNKVQI